ncbi:unnamed protein product [Rhizophagus irregularis]|nr:unnamed protein product [Rhizophagus irregularis]
MIKKLSRHIHFFHIKGSIWLFKWLQYYNYYLKLFTFACIVNCHMEVMVYNQILLRAFKSANQFLFRFDYGGYGNFGGIGVFGDFDLHGCEETNSPALDEE